MINSLLFCADATPTMGTGHVMRSLALALTARHAGMQVAFASRISVDWVKKRLTEAGIEVLPRAAMDDFPAAQADKWDWLVFDGYHFDLSWQRLAKEKGFRVMVIDDCRHLPEYACDLLLNQNIGADNYVYAGEIGEKCLGLQYALLRPEFGRMRKRVTPKTGARNLLLNLGGGDASGHLPKIAAVLAIPEMTGRHLRIIKGGMPKASIEEAMRDCPASWEILDYVADMAQILIQTDLCITAGGSTCWELCCLGVPFLTVEVADNQRQIIAELASQSLAPQFSPAHFLACLADECDLALRSANLMGRVDGLGAARLTACLARAE